MKWILGRTTSRWGFLWARLAALILVFGLLPAGLTSAQARQGMEHLRSLSGQEFETHWISMMIHHHEGAVEMSGLVPDRAMHQEVKDLAQKIIADQTREINDMTAWLQQWYGVALLEEMLRDMPGMGMGEHEMIGLRNLQGDAFDKQFLVMMRMHHQGAVEMAELVPDRATHEELKTLARNIIISQSAEIGQMAGWLKAWYNLDPASMPMPQGRMSGGGHMMPGEPMMGGGTMHGGTMSGTGAMPGMPRTGVAPGIEVLLLLIAVAGTAIILVLGGFSLRRRT